MYRVVPRRYLVEVVFGGSSFKAARALSGMERDGHLSRVPGGPAGAGMDAFALTRGGAAWYLAARRRKRKRSDGLDDDQHLAIGFGPERQLAHDRMVADAVADDTADDRSKGAKIRRVRLDGEIRGILARASEKARAAGGEVEASASRREAATDLGLPIGRARAAIIPDALVELEHSDGRVEVRGVEIGTSAYSSTQMAAKHAAGFRVYVPQSGGGAARSGPVGFEWTSGGR